MWKQPARRAQIISSIKVAVAKDPAKRKAQLDAARALIPPATEATKAKIRTARMRQKFPTKMTNIEVMLHDAFKKSRLKFEMHRTMFGRYQPDFVFDNARLIVQADGDYWHAKEVVRKRDELFNAAAEADGWTVWRFPGSVIMKDLKACSSAVAKFVRAAKK